MPTNAAMYCVAHGFTINSVSKKTAWNTSPLLCVVFPAKLSLVKSIIIKVTNCSCLLILKTTVSVPKKRCYFGNNRTSFDLPPSQNELENVEPFYSSFKNISKRVGMADTYGSQKDKPNIPNTRHVLYMYKM